jgi:hypothetical protein
MSVDAAGTRLPNGIDFFWDGEGAGNCWQTASSDTVEPITMPSCPGSYQRRFISDPNKLFLFADCSTYSLETKTLPAGCDWFDTPPRPGVLTPTFTTQSVFPALQLIAVLLLFAALLRRRGRAGPLALLAAAAAAVGAAALFLSSAEQLNHLAPPAIALLGIGWLGVVRSAPTRGLALVTLLLGISAILEAVDSGIVMLPSPIGPVWIRVVLEIAWVIGTSAALMRTVRVARPPEPG